MAWSVLIAGAAVATLLGLPPRAAADWRQYHGENCASVADPHDAPAAAGQLAVAWKAPLPGTGPSGPIVVAGRVFVTAASGAQQDRLHLQCFDAASGRPLWQRQFWATGHTVVNPFGGVAAPTPASDGQHVVALYSSSDLACFDLEGNLLWLRGLGLESPTTRNDVGMASSPLIVGDTVVVQLENQGESFAAGIDLANGRTRWRVELEHGAAWTTPFVYRGGSSSGAATTGTNGKPPLVLIQSRVGLSAHDPRTGRQLWNYEAECHTMATGAAAGPAIYLPATGLRKLLPGDGSAPPQVLWEQSRLRLDSGSPIVHGDQVYFIKGGGILVAADAAEGQVRWQLRLKGPFWSTPVLAGDRIYAVNHEGLVQAVQLGSGGSQGRVAGTLQLDKDVLASPAVAGGALFFRTNRYLWKAVAGGPGT